MKVSVAPLRMHIVTTHGGDKPNHWESIWEVIFHCSNINCLNQYISYGNAGNQGPSEVENLNVNINNANEKVQ
ncbi:hypothetical protein PS15m_010781 [Mucor circinelloides]